MGEGRTGMGISFKVARVDFMDISLDVLSPAKAVLMLLFLGDIRSVQLLEDMSKLLVFLTFSLPLETSLPA